MSTFTESLLKLKKVSTFAGLIQKTKNSEIYFSPYHTSNFLYPEFSQIYLGTNISAKIQVFITSENVNFTPSHFNIPIFPPGGKLIHAYTALMEYYGSSIDLVIYNNILIPERVNTVEIGGILFFDVPFEIQFSASNLKFKLSQQDSFFLFEDSTRIINYYRTFLKYLALLSDGSYITYKDQIIDNIFSYLGEKFKNQFQGVGGNVGKGCITGTARILDNKRLSFQNTWLNNFEKGDIIIAHNTHVSYMKYIFDCGGIITENHNLLSHASLISRELGIPLVLGIENIFLKIFDGDTISMNSDTGELKIIKRFWE